MAVLSDGSRSGPFVPSSETTAVLVNDDVLSGDSGSLTVTSTVRVTTSPTSTTPRVQVTVRVPGS